MGRRPGLRSLALATARTGRKGWWHRGLSLGHANPIRVARDRSSRRRRRPTSACLREENGRQDERIAEDDRGDAADLCPAARSYRRWRALVIECVLFVEHGAPLHCVQVGCVYVYDERRRWRRAAAA